MFAAPKYILHSPVSDASQLEAFVERCLAEKVSLLAIIGFGCAELEDFVDEIIVGTGEDESRFMCTTSHPGETLENVLAFVQTWESDQLGEVRQFRF